MGPGPNITSISDLMVGQGPTLHSGPQVGQGTAPANIVAPRDNRHGN